MINNRQNGRRRGRGGGGPRSPNHSPNQGNRQDNRNRGNAAQLLEKYKALARDAQLQGDRVQSEYWLQFAEHYYRVLNENRARFEEQRRHRDDYSDEDEDQDEVMNAGAEGEDGDDRDERDEREFRADRGNRQEREPREARDNREGRDRPRREYREERNGHRPRRFEEQGEAREEEGEAEERISLEVLPPAISAGDGEVPAKAPRRRTRRPRGEAGEEIAPAA